MAREGQLARNVRAGLDAVSLQVLEGGAATPEPGPLDEISFGKPIRRHVWEFACIFALIGCAVAAWILYKGGSFATGAGLITAAAVLLMTGAFAPTVLLPVWRSWMLFAHYLGIVMSTLIVAIAWTIMLVPVAILLKLIGKKVMDLSFDRSVSSYWEERDQKYHDFKLLERQF